jgi:large subunit ribosomal protein L6
MSRIGNKIIALPKGVTVTVGDQVTVKGPKGELSRPLVTGTTISVDGDVVTVARTGDSRTLRANHGLMRSLLNNMVIGVSAGFEKRLEILGVGYKAQSKGSEVVFNLGYSHPINYKVPDGITVDVDKQGKISVKGIDKRLQSSVDSVRQMPTRAKACGTKVSTSASRPARPRRHKVGSSWEKPVLVCSSVNAVRSPSGKTFLARPSVRA